MDRQSLLLFSVLFLLGGCKDDPSLRFRLLPVPRGNVGLVSETDPEAICNTDGAIITELAEGSYSIRLTFFRPPASSDSLTLRNVEPVCSTTIAPSVDGDFLVPLPENDQDLVLLRAEAFSDGGASNASRLELTGIARLDRHASVSAVYLEPRDQATCKNLRANTPRAFHSATLLPNGEVLLVGGLVGGKDDSPRPKPKAYATGKVEVFDPATRTFRSLSSQVNARAFHQAFLLDSPAAGPYRVLLLGGIAPDSDSTALVDAGRDPEPFLFSPETSAKPAGATLISYTPSAGEDQGAIVVEELAGLPSAMFAHAALTADGKGLLFSGGAALFASASAFQTPSQGMQRVELDGDKPSASASTTVALAKTRVGHQATILASTPAAEGVLVVVGGTMDMAAIGSDADTPAESVSKGQALTPQVSPDENPTAWHTLTPIGVADHMVGATPNKALLAGGYRLEYQAPALQFARVFDPTPSEDRLRFVVLGDTIGSKLQIVEDKSQTVFAQAGYHDAIVLYDGSVLLSGGSTQSRSYRAQGQLARVTPGGQTSSAATTLTIPRYGHRAVRLLDNTILFTGGVASYVDLDDDEKPIRPYFLRRAEIFNPRDGSSIEDYPFHRKPGGNEIDQANIEFSPKELPPCGPREN
jgi:hypothetical protein